MLMNHKTRPICHGRMGKGNNHCSRGIGRVLAESLLGAVKSKANRDVTIRTRLPLALLLLRFQCTKLRINFPEKLEMAIGIRPFQYEPVAVLIMASTGRVQVTKKCHENSGGYALCLLYIVMCAILRVVAYFLSVNLLHICTLSFWLYVWHNIFL